MSTASPICSRNPRPTSRQFTSAGRAEQAAATEMNATMPASARSRASTTSCSHSAPAPRATAATAGPRRTRQSDGARRSSRLGVMTPLIIRGSELRSEIPDSRQGPEALRRHRERLAQALSGAPLATPGHTSARWRNHGFRCEAKSTMGRRDRRSGQSGGYHDGGSRSGRPAGRRRPRHREHETRATDMTDSARALLVAGAALAIILVRLALVAVRADPSSPARLVAELRLAQFAAMMLTLDAGVYVGFALAQESTAGSGLDIALAVGFLVLASIAVTRDPGDGADPAGPGVRGSRRGRPAPRRGHPAAGVDAALVCDGLRRVRCRGRRRLLLSAGVSMNRFDMGTAEAERPQGGAPATSGTRIRR